MSEDVVQIPREGCQEVKCITPPSAKLSFSRTSTYISFSVILAANVGGLAGWLPAACYVLAGWPVGWLLAVWLASWLACSAGWFTGRGLDADN